MSVERYAVIGNPVSHSLSPQIHQAFASQVGHVIEYTTIEASLEDPPNGFEAVVGAFFEAGGSGVNVTIPFKVAAFRWVDRSDALAAQAKAVNTIKRTDSGCEGFNTDGLGLVRDLERLGWPVVGARILVLGAGGAVRGILGSLDRLGPRGITVANRTLSRAEALAEEFPYLNVVPLDATGTGWDLVINGTSAGLANDAAIVSRDSIRGAYCYDLFYRRDGETPFVRWARESSKGAADGLGMLVMQAAEAFRIWRGVLPETDGVLAALRA